MKTSYKKIAALTLGLTFVSGAYATDETFTASIRLIAPIVISETKGLDFLETTAGLASADVVTAPLSSEAALFTATGEASRAVTGSVVETSITMTTGDSAGTTKQITVNAFSTGGDMSGAGAATFDGSGNLSNLRIGGTAQVQLEDIAGLYAGTATFRLVYN